MIPSNSRSSKMSVIVVGGRGIISTEILDDMSGNWRFGPPLIAYVIKSVLLMHPKGGVIMVAGSKSEYSPTNLIYRLRHAGCDAKWEQLPKPMVQYKYYHSAMLVPSELANCTIV
jgi:hypothetical protein